MKPDKTSSIYQENGGADFQKVKQVLIKTLLLNWLVALVRIFIGVLSGSLSILTDGFHSFFDGMSNIFGLAGIKLAAKPRDKTHPYGHQKFETLAVLGIAFLILITSYEFLKAVIGRFIHPYIPEITVLSFLIMGGSLAVDIFVCYYERFWGKKLKSAILIADSLHTKTHFFITPSVILGMVAVKVGFPIFDPLIALFVIFMLGKLAWEIIQGTISVLCDQALVDIKEIQKIATTIKGVKSSHQIRTRGDTHHVFLDMHITLDSNLSLKRAHYISHQLKEKIIKEIPKIKDVVIHIEPRRGVPR